ncbi:MAG: STAS domain-containing protein [Actinomycetota bacterium]
MIGAEYFRRRIEHAVELTPRKLHVDCSDVSFIDSMGVRAILYCARLCRTAGIRLSSRSANGWQGFSERWVSPAKQSAPSSRIDHAGSVADRDRRSAALASSRVTRCFRKFVSANRSHAVSACAFLPSISFRYQ